MNWLNFLHACRLNFLCRMRRPQILFLFPVVICLSPVFKGLSCVLVEQAHVVEEGCSDEGVTAMDWMARPQAVVGISCFCLTQYCILVGYKGICNKSVCIGHENLWKKMKTNFSKLWNTFVASTFNGALHWNIRASMYFVIIFHLYHGLAYKVGLLMSLN